MRLSIPLLLLVLSAPALAQGCAVCEGKGWVVCPDPRCRQGKCGDFEHRCDIVYRLPCCRGIRRRPCPECENPIVGVRLGEEGEVRRAWVRQMMEVDRHIGVRFVHVETRHFRLHYSVPEWKKGSKRYPRQEAAHFFAERLEEIAEEFEEVTGALPARKQEVYLVADLVQQRKSSQRLLGRERDGALVRFGNEGRYVDWPDPKRFRTDEDFHASVTHNAARLLAQAAIEYQPNFPPIMDAGFGHLFERRRFKSSRTFSIEKTDDKDPWIKTLFWARMVRGEIRSKENESLETLTRSFAYSPREQAHAWTFVRFLVDGPRRKEFQRFYRTLKEGATLEEASRRVLGWDARKLERAWLSWARKR